MTGSRTVGYQMTGSRTVGYQMTGSRTVGYHLMTGSRTVGYHLMTGSRSTPPLSLGRSTTPSNVASPSTCGAPERSARQAVSRTSRIVKLT